MNDLLPLLQALLALALVCALVFVAWRALERGGLFARGRGSMHVEERLGIDVRNALVIVRVEGRRLLLATGGQGPARLVTELSPSAPAPEGAP